MHKTVLAIAFLSIFQTASASDIFTPKPTISVGGVSNAPQTQVQAADASFRDKCAALVQERRAIDYIDQKQIWVPIEQQNANYYRMQALKAEMSARGCAY
jgi:hypothetical protein